MVCCNCLPNTARQPSINVGRDRSGTDFRRHPSEALVGIGCCFAGARQLIFLSNALLIGFGMAVAAAAVHEADTEIGKWLGSSWFYLISGVSLLGMMSCTFGMTGACYQKWFLLILYMLSLVLLMLFEGFVIFVMATSKLDQILEDNWDGLDDSLHQTISDEFDCDPLIPKECINAAKGDAENVRNVMYYICALSIVFQMVMVAFCVSYMVGLRRERRRVKIVLGIRTPGSPSASSPRLQRINSNEYDKVLYKSEKRARGILV